MYFGGYNVDGWDGEISEIMEAAWSVEVLHECKRVTTQWAIFKEFYNDLEGGIIDMVSVQQEMEIIFLRCLWGTRF